MSINSFLHSTRQTEFNPLTHMSDQDRISPYNINQINDLNKEKYQFWDN